MAKTKMFQISRELTAGLQDTISAAQNYAGELNIEVIPLTKIDFDPENPRELMISFLDIQMGLNKEDSNYHKKNAEMETLQSMANTIKDQGVLNPIIVYKHGEKYRLVAGERRTLASLLAGKKDIYSKVLDKKPSALKLRLIQWTENIEREDLTLSERLKNLLAILNAYCEEKSSSIQNVSIKEIQQIIGCSHTLAGHYKSLLNSKDELKQYIFNQRINNLEKASYIAGIQDDHLQNKLLELCAAGATLKQLKSSAINAHADKNVTSKRGPKVKKINFGSTKNSRVAKIIIESLLQNEKYTHIYPNFSNIDWQDYTIISRLFQRLITNLERSL